MNNPHKIFDIMEIDKRKKIILDLMIEEVQERNEQKLFKKRAAIEMKYLKPELLKLNKKKSNNKEQLIKSHLICKEFEEFILQKDENDNNEND
jgi:hypothetical protein